MSETATNVLVRIEPALVGVEDAASMLGISVTAFKTLDRTGQLGPMPVRVGMCRRRLYKVSELRAWVEAGCPNREKWQVIKDEKNF
jgi:hypothetical protein